MIFARYRWQRQTRLWQSITAIISRSERLLKAEILRRCTPLYALSPELRNRIVREYLTYEN